MEAIADLVGLTVDQLTTLTIAGVALVVGWYVLRLVLKIAMRVFVIGCVGIASLVCLLYVGFVVFTSGAGP